jgi:nitrite reductase (NADH) large subunit
MTSPRQRLVVIGNGMAGCRAVEDILKRDPNRYDITIFGAEPRVNYNRIMLSPVLAGEKAFDDIVINDEAWYRDNGIVLHAGRAVQAIDRARKMVVAEGGLSVPYDKLILACGSDPIRLPLPGADLVGVVTFRDLNDVAQMVAAADAGGEAVVIGGGLLGLEEPMASPDAG